MSKIRRQLLCLTVALMVLSGLAVNAGNSATLSVSSANSYYLPRTGYSWGNGGLPSQPSAEWHLANGNGFDTSGGVFVNYGLQSLTTGLAILNAPSLAEGPLSAHQSALHFNGASNRLGINDAAILDCNSEALTIFAIVRAPDASGSDKNIVIKDVDDQAGSAGYLLKFNVKYVYFYASDGAGSPPGSSALVGYDISSLYGQWISVGVTFRPSAACSLFVNGAYANRNNTTFPALGSLSSASKFAIGSSYTGNRYLKESLALVMVWDGVAVTGSQMDSLHHALMPTGSTVMPFPTIQSAIRQSTAGDVVSIGSGIYCETIEIPKALTLRGAVTDPGYRPVIFGTGLNSSAGVTAIQTTARVDLGFIDIRGYTGGVGVLADSTSDGSLFHHLTIDSCRTGIKFYGDCDGDTLANCTIDGVDLSSSYGVQAVGSSEAHDATLVWVNNLVMRSVSGLAADTSHFVINGDYNDVFGATTPYTQISAGAHDLALDPNLTGISQNDYTLRFGSKVVNQGLLLHSGVAPFLPNQSLPDLGAWELPVGVRRSSEFAWSRGSWGGR